MSTLLLLLLLLLLLMLLFYYIHLKMTDYLETIAFEKYRSHILRLRSHGTRRILDRLRNFHRSG